MFNITKKDIVSIVAQKTGVPKTQVSAIFDEIFDYIKFSIKNNDSVTIKKFGRFKKIKRTIKTIKVPTKKEPLKNIESIKCSFKMSQNFFD